MQCFKRIARALALGIPILFLALPAARAATLDFSGKELIGAYNVDVGGVMYDVSFQDGSCVGLFGGCDELTDFTFQDESSAISAALALIAQVFGNDDAWDKDPELTRGCEATNICNIRTVYALIPRGAPRQMTAGVHNKKDDREDELKFSNYGISLDTGDADNNVYAIWSAAKISSVPVPAAIWLFGTALIGFIGMSRKTKVG